MKKWYPIRIPKPCHEDWQKMTPNKKGKFCDLCENTVVDFTKKSELEIQDFLIQNKGKKVCGHFYKEQLATVNIEIPTAIFRKQYSYARMFALALLVTMGTSLLNCKSDGKIKKIETVEVIDSIIPKIKIIKKDSVLLGKPTPPKSPISPLIQPIGIVVIESDSLNKTCNTKVYNINTPTIGEVIIEDEIPVEELIELGLDDVIFGYVSIEQKPQFKNSKSNSKEAFNKKMQKFVRDNFKMNLTIGLGLKEGRHKIYTQFIIDKNGFVKDIEVRAPRPHLKKMVIKMLQKLPQFIPGKR